MTHLPAPAQGAGEQRLSTLPLRPATLCRAPSDLVFVIKEQPHPRFTRRGNNLHTTVTVSCCAGRLDGCGPGCVLKRRGEGMGASQGGSAPPRGGSRGWVAQVTGSSAPPSPSCEAPPPSLKVRTRAVPLPAAQVPLVTALTGGSIQVQHFNNRTLPLPLKDIVTPGMERAIAGVGV